MRFRHTFICILSLCLAASAAGQGQVRDFRYALDANPLLGFNNAALLTTLGDEGFSEAITTVTKENGAVIPLEGSPDSWTVDVGTEAFRRVSDRLVFSGRLAYTYFRGNRMGGQILMDPAGSLINFLEEDTATMGSKKREVYSLSGGLGYALDGRWSAGIRFDYTAADQTKYKDPRFLNVLMDLTVSPGVSFKVSDAFSLGGNLIWRHSLEQLSGDIFGTMDRQYYILVDQGGFLGAREVFDGDAGYVSTQNVRPLANDRYGLGLQVAVGTRTRFLGQLTGLWRTGYFGNRTSTSVVFCEFRGPETKFEGILLHPAGGNLHRLEWDAAARFPSKWTNIYNYKAEAGMNTTVEYQGQNETLTRAEYETSLAYTLEKGVSGYRPDWVFGVSANAYLRDQHTVLYPEYRDQSYLNLTASLCAERSVRLSSGCLSVGADLLFGAGTGNAKTDGSFSTGTSKQKSFDDWLYRQFEFDTASRAGGGVSFAWTWLGARRVVPYVKVSDTFLILLSEPQYLQGRTRNVATLSIGCNF